MPVPIAGSAPATDTVELPLAPAVGPDVPRRRRRRRTVLAASAIVVVAAVAGVGAWLGTRGTPSGKGALTPTVTTAVVPVTTGSMRKTVSASGTLEPAHESDLSFAVPGVVTAVDVSVGQTVGAGQRLATVAVTALEATEQGDAASLAAAEARLASDQADGASTSQVDSDDAAVTSAQAQLSSAQAAVADATLSSPIAGTVAAVNLIVGDQVPGSGNAGDGSSGATATGTSTSGSSTGGASSAQVVVVSTNAFVVDTSVDATEVGSLAAGQPATVIPSGGGRVLPATVASVGLIASGSSGVASFPVVLNVTGSPSGLYAGTSVAVSVVVRDLHGVVEVPAAAVSYRGNGAEVVVVEHGRHVPTPVTTGLTTGGETQITSGVRAGEQVAVRQVSFSTAPTTGARRTRAGPAPGGGFVKQVQVSPTSGPGGVVVVTGGTGG